MTNAVKFTPKGEVRIKLTRRLSGGALLLRGEVKDSGIGIAADRVGKLFQAFSQIDSSTTRRFGGTGLGLAITQRLLQMMHGRIWVESEIEKGSTFRFEIPIQAANVENATPSPLDAKDLAGLRVLIVDDNSTNLGILKMQVRSWGMSATLCKSAKEALELVQKEDEFQLAIFDVMMPEMDGYQLTNEVRKLCPSLPILLLTSIGFGKKTSAESLGISAVLSKPVKIRPLLNAIRLALRIGVADPACPPTIMPENLAQDCPLKILVAEDNTINQRVAELILRRLGYPATFVPDGLRALEELSKSPYDVILLDVQMPKWTAWKPHVKFAEDLLLKPPMACRLDGSCNRGRPRRMSRGRNECLLEQADSRGGIVNDLFDKPISANPNKKAAYEQYPYAAEMVTSDARPEPGPGIRREEDPPGRLDRATRCVGRLGRERRRSLVLPWRVPQFAKLHDLLDVDAIKGPRTLAEPSRWPPGGRGA